MLPAVTNASILSLLEILMGPFIQLESLRINLTEPAEKKTSESRNAKLASGHVGFIGRSNKIISTSSCL